MREYIKLKMDATAKNYQVESWMHTREEELRKVDLKQWRTWPGIFKDFMDRRFNVDPNDSGEWLNGFTGQFITGSSFGPLVEYDGQWNGTEEEDFFYHPDYRAFKKIIRNKMISARIVDGKVKCVMKWAYESVEFFNVEPHPNVSVKYIRDRLALYAALRYIYNRLVSLHKMVDHAWSGKPMASPPSLPDGKTCGCGEAEAYFLYQAFVYYIMDGYDEVTEYHDDYE